ncbi:hypothetical protein CDD83_6037 [Cordyceps sp. RAO-2017]|nr:hypothetical protein CDD83_6037 [Cordyceps sp. RAO-2017]
MSPTISCHTIDSSALYWRLTRAAKHPPSGAELPLLLDLPTSTSGHYECALIPLFFIKAVAVCLLRLRSTLTEYRIKQSCTGTAFAMAQDNPQPAGVVSELLYHTILTVIDYHKDRFGAIRLVFVLGTHVNLDAAKAFSIRALEKLNFVPDDFEQYAVRSLDKLPVERWIHGDGVLVFARAPAGQEFFVAITTTPNNELLPTGSDGEPVLPQGIKSLHYVLQSTTDYNKDRTGSAQTTEIEGAYLHRKDAFIAARKTLDEKQYVEFDTRDDENMADEWPFGEDVVIHAVSETGQNEVVTVKTVPWANAKKIPTKERVLA